MDKKAPIPVEASYTTIGKGRRTKTRSITGVICPTPLSQSMGFRDVKPIYVDMGDVEVDWKDTSAGFEMLTNEKV